MNFHVLNILSVLAIACLGYSVKGMLLYFHLWQTPFGIPCLLFVLFSALALKMRYVDNQLLKWW
jgi:hypothetical protein